MAWESKLTLAGVEAAILDAAARGVMLASEHVLGESRKVVPIEEGTLGRSGRVSVETTGTSVAGTITFNTPYAARQHEDLRYRHDKGRTAKYLERPLVAERGTVAAIVATALRQAINGSSATPAKLLSYTTKAGKTRTATQAQINNWTRGTR